VLEKYEKLVELNKSEQEYVKSLSLGFKRMSEKLIKKIQCFLKSMGHERFIFNGIVYIYIVSNRIM
jgi:hypothetical protein